MSEVDTAINLLGRDRFNKEANMVYRVPVNRLPKIQVLNTKTDRIEQEIDFESEDMLDVIVKFINHHESKQVPRLKQLKRYMLADNNIKYRSNKPDGRSDNRIASDFANFIVAFKLGVLLGNPLKYTGDEEITDKINLFSSQANEDYHNQLMGHDTFGFGRAYEWIGRDEFAKETIAKFDVEQTFIIYDNTKNKNSICGVHYSKDNFLDEYWTTVTIYGNNGKNYQFTAVNNNLNDLVLDEGGITETHFRAVQINEWINNEERLSDFENVLDSIDAYDLSRSEMANFQQDTSEAYLVIKGNPDTGQDDDGEGDGSNSKLEVFKAMQKARMLVLGDKKIYDGTAGSDPDAYYLKKEYDVQGVESNDSRTVADILRFTSLIDFTDENIGSNQSGIGFRFKGWGSDNDRKNKERMVKKALMRRLRLLASSWELKDSFNVAFSNIKRALTNIFNPNKTPEPISLYDKINSVEIKFTPNVPQSDEEIMSVISGMNSIVSEETLCEMAERLTGVPAGTEIERIKSESKPIDVFDVDNEPEGD